MPINFDKDIKGLKYIVVFLLALFWIFYATPAIMLQIPYVRTKVASIASTELSNYLGVPVRIGKVDIGWFNRIVLDNVYLADQERKPLFVANHDKFNNSAKVNMTVNHNHFRDLTYNVNIQAKNMLVYDIPKKTNPMIYGSAFGTGTTTIQGSGKLINFDINLRSDPKTAITLNFMDESASEYDFINFVNKKEIQQQAAEAKNDSVRKTLITHKTDDATEYKMNFLFDVTPDATIDVIMISIPYLNEKTIPS